MANIFSSRFHKGPPPTLQIIYRGVVVAQLTKSTSSTETLYTF